MHSSSLSLACPRCGSTMAEKRFDSRHWLADKNSVWTCGQCNTYYSLKELKKLLWRT